MSFGYLFGCLLDICLDVFWMFFENHAIVNLERCEKETRNMLKHII